MYYTGKGDNGMSCLSDGKMYKKSDINFECIGMIDELNARLGHACCCTQTMLKRETELHNLLLQIQHELMVICSLLTMQKEAHESDDEYRSRLKENKLVPGRYVSLEMLEKLIDDISERIEQPLNKRRTVPGGCALACEFYLCQSHCRTTERMLMRIKNMFCEENKHIIPFINRLSTFFLIIARYANRRFSILDIPHS